MSGPTVHVVSLSGIKVIRPKLPRANPKSKKEKRMAVLDIAHWAIRAVPERVKAQGQHIPSARGAPEHWELQLDGTTVLVASGCQRRFDDPFLSNMIVVRPEQGKKFLDLSWMPDAPDDPPECSIRLAPELASFMAEFGGDLEYQRLMAATA